jgi:hypothetical protein
MTTYRPTRSCPHPLCRPLHLIAAAGALLAVAAVAPYSPWILGLLAVGALFSVGIYQLVHRQTMVASVKEELNQSVTITTRPAWVRAAVAMDVIWTVLVLATLASVLTDRSASGLGEPSRPALLAAVAVGVALTVTAEGLHRRAVRIQRVQPATPAPHRDSTAA